MRKRFHWLKKPKLRADWSKENLYNLSRAREQSLGGKTFFQQKWEAKAWTRAYHGEQIREKQWQRMFRRTLPAVVPMSHGYLARNDGSEMATGRGSGEETEDPKESIRMTPYMAMTYGPIERRLDTAIWRALFASSARQARQFVVHGWVKVNGKKMIYPGYQLNPGDMFQIDPERVMWATGARKDEHRYVPRDSKNEEATPATRPAPREESIPDEDAEDAELNPEAETAQVEVKAEAEGKPTVPKDDEAKKVLTSLLGRTKAILDGKEELSAKRKQDLRGFQQALRKMLSRSKNVTTSVTDDLEARLAAISAKLTNNSQTSAEEAAADRLTEKQEELLQEALEKMRENPYDPTKPYLTPWRPRPYMSAFAFIPRYLEVNQNICAAVYLRHPVARPELAEVPTPFNYETNQLAFNWYLRRR